MLAVAATGSCNLREMAGVEGREDCGEGEVGTYLTKAAERKGEIEIVRGAKLKLRRAPSKSLPALRFLREPTSTRFPLGNTTIDTSERYRISARISVSSSLFFSFFFSFLLLQSQILTSSFSL